MLETTDVYKNLKKRQ